MRPLLPTRLLLFIMLFIMLGSASTAAPNEKALWQIWELHQENADDHKKVIQACLLFKKQNPADPFVAVTSTLAAWHVMKLDLNKQATALMKPYLALEGDGINEGARIMTQTWITRMDREHLAAALKFYYGKEVKYPASLRELAAFPKLPPELAPPTNDRFGKPWKYKLAGFKTIPGLFDQKYELESGKLGIDSDLEESLIWPYGERMHMTAVRMKDATTVEMVRGTDIQGPRVPLSLNRKVDDVLLAYVGQHLLVFSNKDHWTIVAKPGGNR